MNERILQALARTIGTPYYCYDAPSIRERFRRVTAALPNDISYLYSLKANPNKAVVAVLHSEGAGCEVCSLAELETALAAGVAPHEIIFLGPAKSAAEVTRCVDLGIHAVVVESVPELGQIERVASARGVIQPVALRINPALPVSGAKLVMGGQPTQFGIDEDQLPDALNALGCCAHVTLVGIHAYLGSRILEVRAIRENTKQILDLATRIEAARKRRLAFVDIGGGFGVNYFHNEVELDLASLGRELDGMVRDFKRRCPTTRILCELGRYLVAKAGVFVTSVRTIKRCRGRLFAICDGGSNCHASAAGLGALFRRNFPIARLTGTGTGSAVYTVTGPLCTPTDVIGESITLGNLECGDLIGIYDSGAYGASASPVHFLGFGHPAEVLVDDGAAQLIRRRTTVEEILASQVSVPIDLPG